MPAGYTVGAALGFLTVLYSNGVRQRRTPMLSYARSLLCMQGGPFSLARIAS